jgi:hypothetical protein
MLHVPRATTWESNMPTLCPIALAAGCKKCPIFSICPLKGVIGDQGKGSQTKSESSGNRPDATASAKPTPKPGGRRGAKPGTKSGARRGKRA